MNFYKVFILCISFSKTYGQKINLNSNTGEVVVNNTGTASYYELCNSFERTNEVPSQGCYDYLNTYNRATNTLIATKCNGYSYSKSIFYIVYYLFFHRKSIRNQCLTSLLDEIKKL